MNRDSKSAYEAIVEMCVKYGIIPKAEMEKWQLYVILEHLLQGVGTCEESI